MGAERPWRLQGPDPRGPDPAGAWRPCIWPKYGNPLRVVVLGFEVVVVPTHWDGRRNAACLAPEACAGCAARRQRKPQYHVPVWDCKDGVESILILNSAGAAALLSAATARGQLRGLEVVLHRVKHAKSETVEVEVLAAFDPDGALKPPFHVEPMLRRLFNVDVLPTYGEEEGGGYAR